MGTGYQKKNDSKPASNVNSFRFIETNHLKSEEKKENCS
jgi:hypothetical protein